MADYVDLNYKPSRNDLIAEFYVEPNRISLELAAENVAKESSIGTWTSISTMKERIIKDLMKFAKSAGAEISK